MDWVICSGNSVLLILLQLCELLFMFFFFSSRRRHTRLQGDWSSDVCSSDLVTVRCTLTTPDALNGNRSTTEGNRSIWVYQLVVDACNQPTGSSCPNTEIGRASCRERV